MSLLTQASLVLTPNAVKASKLYSVIPSNGNGDMTVVRATTATRVNSSGLIESVAANVARLNYDSVGGCPSILVEPQRTNLILRSEEFENTSWAKQGVSVIANSIISPNGLMNADTVTSTTTGQARIEQLLAVPTINTTYTFSIYAKAASSPFVALTRFSGNFFATFNLSSGTIINQTAGVNATIISVGNGWYRISIIVNALTTDTSSAWKIHPCTSTDPFSSVVGNSIYLWGGQLEIGAYQSSYVPTVATSVTRNQDVISKTGISNLIGQTEGTLFVESAALANDLTTRSISISDGTANNRITLSYASVSNLVLLNGTANGVSFASLINYTLPDETQFAKIAIRYRANNITFWVNGVKRGTDITSQVLPINLSRLALDNSIGSFPFFAKINSLQLYKTFLTDAECIALTTL